MPVFFFAESSCLSADSVYRACVNTCATVDAGVCVNNTLVTLLADRVDRAGVITCAAVNALVGNLVSQEIHPLLFEIIFKHSNLQNRKISSMCCAESPA